MTIIKAMLIEEDYNYGDYEIIPVKRTTIEKDINAWLNDFNLQEETVYELHYACLPKPNTYIQTWLKDDEGKLIVDEDGDPCSKWVLEQKTIESLPEYKRALRVSEEVFIPEARNEFVYITSKPVYTIEFDSLEDIKSWVSNGEGLEIDHMRYHSWQEQEAQEYARSWQKTQELAILKTLKIYTVKLYS